MNTGTVSEQALCVQRQGVFEPGGLTDRKPERFHLSSKKDLTNVQLFLDAVSLKRFKAAASCKSSTAGHENLLALALHAQKTIAWEPARKLHLELESADIAGAV